MENDNTDFQSNQASEKNEYTGSGRSPDEVKTKVKDAVAKGVAAFAGALKGFTEEAQKHDLANTTKSAIQKAGEATRQVAGTATDEIRKTRDHVKHSARASGLTKGPIMPRPLDRMGGSTSRTMEPNVPDLRKVDLGKTDEELE